MALSAGLGNSGAYLNEGGWECGQGLSSSCVSRWPGCWPGCWVVMVKILRTWVDGVFETALRSLCTRQTLLWLAAPLGPWGQAEM